MVVDSLFSSSSLSSCDGGTKNQKSWDGWGMGIASCKSVGKRLSNLVWREKRIEFLRFFFIFNGGQCTLPETQTT
jgi:hypothetical protein